MPSLLQMVLVPSWSMADAGCPFSISSNRDSSLAPAKSDSGRDNLGLLKACVYASYVNHIGLDFYKCIIYKSFMLREIGSRIRQERKSRGITQAELGKILAMSRTTIGQIENGTVQDVGVRKLIRLLEFLGLEMRVRPAGRPPTLEELREEEIP